mmetsp:Transcript_12364/g.28096  ORF Transcript_12364/g.28096 Transcript_12364/m.28096 type:complete len:82 (-) Transcript_12364:169-414(-)
MIYGKLESQLRDLNNSNLTIMHLDYEDLFRDDTWRALFRSAGLASASAPKMQKKSDYQGFISNWDEVVQEAHARGYNVTAL